MTKHTPGPWSCDGLLIESDDGSAVCLMGEPAQYPGDLSHDFPNMEANARLIEAAPDLLAELKGWLNDSDGWSLTELRKRYDENMVRRILRSRAVVANAEGTK